MPLKIIVSYAPYPGTELSGFDLGDITIIGDQTTVTSAGSTPNYSMMIFLALGELLWITRQLFEKKQPNREWVGADSSFILWLKKKDSHTIEVYHRNSLIGSDTIRNFAHTLINCIAPILEENKHLIEQDDAGFVDLRDYLHEFRLWHALNH